MQKLQRSASVVGEAVAYIAPLTFVSKVAVADIVTITKTELALVETGNALTAVSSLKSRMASTESTGHTVRVGSVTPVALLSHKIHAVQL